MSFPQPDQPPRHAADFALREVTKHYNGVSALKDVSLSFAAGSTTALIGGSGAGKSTVLRLLLGLDWPDTGTVTAWGEALQRDRLLALRQRVGYVIQEGGLFPHLTALGNLALQPRYLGWEAERIRQRAHELAELARLPIDVLTRYPAELSGGQRQRVALMRGLMADPGALLLDEPLGALDPIVRHELQDELKRIFSELGKTVIVVTHDLAEAAWFADRLVLLRDGHVVQDGRYEDLLDRPADDFVRAFTHAQRALPGGAA
ncbi:ATP-binding cassette domain-containing protein [Dyella jiangningensis]|uniref:ABC transporter ATP-binding protein n=1 Tax=Dyella jiangningensis TaxID=1379159 RepID=A0A328P2V3_9GAMM|nr:ATP-binding cassette domain-containing protein [Dyella jiangningensis]RAO74514.1 ABC transporter ATP-binding protein [Dyella jiangningensis]